MKIITQSIEGQDVSVLVADEGMELIRIHDNFVMGGEVYLGVDYSTGKALEDKPEYYYETTRVEDEDLTQSDPTLDEVEGY